MRTLCAFLLTAFAFLCNGQTFSFSPAPGSPVTAINSILDVVPADLNKDGHMDLVVGNSYNSALHVYLGNGAGQLTPASGSPIYLHSGPQAVVVADFNGDGNPDVATANYQSGDLSVLLGNGTGAFVQASGSPISTAANPYVIEVADFNLDGKMDLISTALNAGTGRVYVHMGQGNGSFTLAAGFPKLAPGAPYDVVAGRLNNDIYPDFAVVNHSSAQISCYLGNSSGTFSAAPGSPISVASGPRTIRLKDLNGDGNNDMVVCMSTGSAVQVLLGSSSGSFAVAPGSPINVGMQTFMSAIEDYDQDGKQDLAVTSQSGKVIFFRGLGTGSFSAVSNTLTLGVSAHPICTSDFNGDGRADIAVGDFLGNKVYVMLNQVCSVSGSIALTVKPGGSVTFTATGTPTAPTTTYTWNFPGSGSANGATASHSFSPGVHTVTLTVSNSLGGQTCTFVTTTTFTTTGCSLTGGIVHASGSNGLVNFAAAVTGTVPGSTYTWQFTGSVTATGTSASHTFLPGSYVVTLTVNNNEPNCVASYTAQVIVSGEPVGINELGELKVYVFPNPAHHTVHVKFDEHEDALMVLYDALGRQVLNRVIVQGGQDIELGNIPGGIYWYTIGNSQSHHSKGKLIILQ